MRKYVNIIVIIVIVVVVDIIVVVAVIICLVLFINLFVDNRQLTPARRFAFVCMLRQSINNLIVVPLPPLPLPLPLCAASQSIYQSEQSAACGFFVLLYLADLLKLLSNIAKHCGEAVDNNLLKLEKQRQKSCKNRIIKYI